MEWIVIGVTAALGLYMAWNIGANDFANSMADAVGSRAITFRRAVFLGVLCEFGGSILVGSHVTDTVRKGIVSPSDFQGEPQILVLGMICALLASALWLHMATWLSMPVSTTHSIVGAVAGFGVVAAGWHSVEWGTMGQIVLSWFISPLVGGVLAYLIFRLILRFVLGTEQPARAAIRAAPVIVLAVGLVVTFSIFLKGGLDRILAERAAWLGRSGGLIVSLALSVLGALIAWYFIARYLRASARDGLVHQLGVVERVFAPLVVITSCSVAFAHGANDVANAVGPLAAVADVMQSGTIKMKVAVPIWVLSLGGVGIVLGLVMYGIRVLRTVGTKITELTPSRGVAADIAAATTVLVCSRLKLPVSTTHTLVGAIIGIGLARGLAGVNRRVIRDIFGCWLITVPAAAIITIVLFLLGRAAHLDAAIKAAMGTAG